jgi:hypothetical protein
MTSNESFLDLLLDMVRSGSRLPDTALLALTRHLGWASDLEEAARARFHSHERATFGDSYMAELLVRRIDISTLPVEVLAHFRAYRALDATEIDNLFSSDAHGSKRSLARIMLCDRKTIRRVLQNAHS